MKAWVRRNLSYSARLLIVLLAATLSMLPIIFIIANSFMGGAEAAARYTSQITAHNWFGTINGEIHYFDMTILPGVFSMSAWRQALIESPENLRYLWNSLILAVPIVLGQLVVAPLAAYGFERAKARHKEKLYFAYIIIMLLPMQALLVPHFIAANYLRINRSPLAIILPAVFAPFGVFLVRQQMKGFKRELIEAAKLDGARELTVFRRIVIPNIKPTITVLAVLAFAEAWNIVDQAVVFIQDAHALPMSVHLSAKLTGDIGVIFALSTLFMIPALAVFVYGVDNLGDGLGYAGRK